MRVLVGTAYFESHRGGIEIVAGQLAREICRSGDEVVWLASDATPPPPAEQVCGAALPVSAWNVAERRLGFPLPLPGPSGLAAIWRAVRSVDALMLHDALYPTNVVAMLAARWYRKPVVLVQHIAAVPYSNPVLRSLMLIANTVIARPMLRAADQVVFISETVARHFAGLRFSAPPQIVFNGVDTDLFRPAPSATDRLQARAGLNLDADDRVVLFVGRFVEKKGLHLIERIARSNPGRVFVLAGWGPIDPNAWGLANVRVLSGLQGASLVPLYQASDALLLPSTGEGLPLVMQEALACGLPVVCGRETASADAALQGLVEGVEIDAAAPGETAQAFLAALDRVLAVSAADAAQAAQVRRDHVLQRYSWTEAARSYVALLRRLTRADARPVGAATAGPAARTP